MPLDGPAGGAAGLGCPADVVADLELAGHVVRLRPFVAILACATAMRRDTRAGDAGAGESLGLPRPCPAAAARAFRATIVPMKRLHPAPDGRAQDGEPAGGGAGASGRTAAAANARGGPARSRRSTQRRSPAPAADLRRSARW